MKDIAICSYIQGLRLSTQASSTIPTALAITRKVDPMKTSEKYKTKDAVILRAIDAIEGRQPLGNPISKPAASAATDTCSSAAGKQR